MSTQKIAPNETFQFNFVNGMPENGKLKVRFDADNNWLEIELPCDSPFTANRLYIEKTEDGFFVRSHNHNSPTHPEEEREINCDFGE